MQKFKNGKFIFRILCIDDILLASSDVNLLLEKFLSPSFNMNDLGEAHWFQKLKFTEIDENGYQDYRKDILRKYSKEIKYACE